MKTICASLSVAVLLWVGQLCFAAQPELTKLTVGYSPISAATLPFFIAVEEKLFQKQGLEVMPIFFGGSPLINAAMLAGEFPIGLIGGAGIISSQLAGSDLIVIGSYLQVLTIDGMAKPEIKSINDLKGKKIAVSRIGASTYFAGLSMLDSRGLKPTDVVFIQAGGVGESFAALANGAVDAAMIGYPYSLKAKQAAFSYYLGRRIRNMDCIPTPPLPPESRGSKSRVTAKSPWHSCAP